MNELERFAEEIEQAAERALVVRFNPLCFTMQEINELIAQGQAPMPEWMWATASC